MTDTPDLLAVAERLEGWSPGARLEQFPDDEAQYLKQRLDDYALAATILRKVHEARDANIEGWDAFEWAIHSIQLVRGIGPFSDEPALSIEPSDLAIPYLRNLQGDDGAT